MSVKIQGLVIRYEGDSAGVSELLRTFTGLIGQNSHADKAVPDEGDPPQPLIAPKPTLDPEPCKLPCVARKKPGPKPKVQADNDRDGDRYAPRGNALKQKIIDYVRLRGPTPVRDLAVAMQRAGQAIGKAVSTSEILTKDDDGCVIALNDD